MLPAIKRFIGYSRRYWVTESSIWLRQGRKWIELRRDEIAALDFETVSRVIIRYYDGKRLVVSLYRFPNSSYDAVCRSLRDSMRHNEEIRGLWDGAEVLKHYD